MWSKSLLLKNVKTLKIIWLKVKSLPNDKILDLSKLEAFADNKIHLNQKQNFLRRIENIEEKGENGGYQHFLRFPQCFQKAYFSESPNVGVAW